MSSTNAVLAPNEESSVETWEAWLQIKKPNMGWAMMPRRPKARKTTILGQVFADLFWGVFAPPALWGGGCSPPPSGVDESERILLVEARIAELRAFVPGAPLPQSSVHLRAADLQGDRCARTSTTSRTTGRAVSRESKAAHLGGMCAGAPSRPKRGWLTGLA